MPMEGELQQQQMICSKCRQASGQMVCQQCYTGIKVLRQQKFKNYSSTKNNLDKALESHLIETNTAINQLISINKKITLRAKIEKLKAKNSQLKENLATKEKEITFLKTSVSQIKEVFPKLEQLKSEALLNVMECKRRTQILNRRKEALTGQIIDQLQAKFKTLMRYLSMDTVEACKQQDWNDLFSGANEELTEEQVEETNLEEMQMFMKMQQEAKQKMASHFVRSIKAINCLAQLHGVWLPYRTNKSTLKMTPSLMEAIYDHERNKFNLSFLRFHQANTVYLYSRACITVHHPDVEQGRLQQLHEALINRLKGYTLNPISLGVSKPLFMLQLTTEGLSSVAVEQMARQKEESKEISLQQQEDLLLMKGMSQLIGFKSIDSSDNEDTVQVLQ